MYSERKSTRFFLKMIVEGPAGVAEALAGLLFEWGALGTEEHGGEVWVYFPEERDTGEFRARLKSACQRALRWIFSEEVVRFHFERIPVEDWQNRWKEHFAPIFVGRTWIVRPSWREVNVSGRIQLVIDPQQAFGTGTHETTQLILEYLEDQSFQSRNVLDVGTGTGILAIAAAQRGARKIVAFDVDPVAVQTAMENARINGVEGKIQFFVADRPAVLPQKMQFHWILVNIQSHIILNLLPDLIPLLKDPAAELVFSGILVEEAARVKRAMEEHSLRIREERSKGEWVCLVAVRNL